MRQTAGMGIGASTVAQTQRSTPALKFVSLTEMQKGLMGLDRATSKTVSVEGKVYKDYQCVYNHDQKAPAMITSEKYTIVQHKEVFNSFISTIKDLGLQGFGTIWNGGNRVALEMSFKGREIKDPTAGFISGDDTKAPKTILLGVRLTNSYDKSLSIHGQLFGFRSACSNGMLLGKFMKEVSIEQRHVGNIDIEAKMEQFIKAIINSEQEMNDLVSETIKDTLEWETAFKVLTKIFENRHSKHVEEILKRLGIAMVMVKDTKTGQESVSYVFEDKDHAKKVSRWDLYNATTNYLTHGEKLSPFMREKLHVCGSKLLMPSQKLVAMIEA